MAGTTSGVLDNKILTTFQFKWLYRKVIYSGDSCKFLTNTRASVVQRSIYCMLKTATNLNGNAGFRMNTRTGPRGYVKLEY